MDSGLASRSDFILVKSGKKLHQADYNVLVNIEELSCLESVIETVISKVSFIHSVDRMWIL